MLPSRSRPQRAPLLALLGFVVLALGLGACSSGGAAKTPPASPQGSAFAPSGDTDLLVAGNDEMPPALANQRGAGDTRRRAPLARQASTPCAEELTPIAPTSSREPVWNRSGPQIRVTWEALAIERDQYQNPRFGRRPQAGASSQLKVVLVSDSHVEAQTNMRGLTARQNRGVAVAPIPDTDIQTFVQGLEQRGFFRLAAPTSTVMHRLQDPNARGHITVERGGESYTLISMRGQGMSPSTKAIPALYSEAKQSILMLRNSSSSMSVVNISGGVLTK